jgi:hypothetical protein
MGRRMQKLSFLFFGLLLIACTEAHGTCDPNARAGDACDGAWTCPATSIEGSTGTHFTEARCEAGVVVERTWSEPVFVSDPIDGGPPGEDAGSHELGCRVLEEEVVSPEGEYCSRPGIAVDGERVRIAWSELYRGVLATREGGTWARDSISFGDRVRRVDLAGEGALVERVDGIVELWDVSTSPHLARTLDGVHTAAQARALAWAGGELHALTVHTHQNAQGLYEWSVHHASGSLLDALEVRDLAVGAAVRAYDVSVDARERVSVLYQDGGIGAPVIFQRDGASETIPLPAGVEPHPYSHVSPALATYEDGRAYALVRRALPAGPLGARYEQLLATRSAADGWELASIAEDEADPCTSVALEEGASCTIDRTTYGPEASIVAGPRGPVVLIATLRTRGERTYSCNDPVGCVPCGWRGELSQEHGLAIAEVGGSLVPLEGVGVRTSPSFVAAGDGGDVHVAIADYEGEGCRVRHVRITCAE